MVDFSFASPYKIFHHPETIESLKRGENVYPLQVEIHPTLLCNHHCKWCITDSVKIGDFKRFDYHRDKTIPFEKFLSLIAEFSEMGVKTLTFSGGGEPLLYPGLEKILEETLSLGMEYGLITNLALKIKDSLFSPLKKASWIRISLDAADPQTHQLLHETKTGDFDLVLENVEKLAKHCFVGINYLVHEENYKGIFDCAVLVKNLGARYIRFAPLYDQSQGKRYAKIWNAVTEEMDRVKTLSSKDFLVFPFKSRFQDLLINEKTYNQCHIHRLHPILGADLKIYACCNFPYTRRYVVADLADRSFKEAWESEERMRFIKSLDPKRCPSCWYNEQNKVISYLVMEDPIHKNFV